jgi:hypothetical protein
MINMGRAVELYEQAAEISISGVPTTMFQEIGGTGKVVFAFSL